MADVNFSIDLIAGTEERMTHRVRKFGFGDGYEQIAADGINTRMVEYEITTRPLTEADATVIRGVLDQAAVGDYLLCTLTPFSSIQRRYRLADNSYERKFLLQGSSGRNVMQKDSLEVFTFTLVEANAN